MALRLGLWMRYFLGFRLAPFVPTPPHVARRMLQLANLRPSDLVYDLGCGDARLLIAAKVYGAKGYGVELDSQLFREAKESVTKEQLGHMISLEQRDAFEVDLTPATVLTLYLSEKGNLKLLPKMRRELCASARVVSFCWAIAGVKPSATTRVDGINLFLYDVNTLRASDVQCGPFPWNQ
ncbi:hypothetical protein GOP47_0009845 [Adiantum capillus-veneris]|uniref:Methyltransferase domain-containing protein n=1 Tax=Adiantum capillus-veneris TaxID=13818 RepID=A0A9D4UXD3_ADICA|nr:hypothetical protein GOP47_0009845 [Adiantum capillus-veneris]